MLLLEDVHATDLTLRFERLEHNKVSLVLQVLRAVGVFYDIVLYCLAVPLLGACLMRLGVVLAGHLLLRVPLLVASVLGLDHVDLLARFVLDASSVSCVLL